MQHTSELRERLQKELDEKAFITKDQRETFDPNGNPNDWFFDIKGVMLRPGNLALISELLWNHLKSRHAFQVGGLETVAIALSSGLVMRAKEDGRELNSFYIRKSRKRDGMQRDIEGALTEEPVVLLDDALNSGHSIVRQVEVLKAQGKRVEEICVLIAYRDPSYYKYLEENGVRIWSIFTLDDFPRAGGMLRAQQTLPPSLSMPFEVEWKFSSETPHRELVLPKSAPALDDERVFFGADNGAMWALNQKDGSVAWSHKTLFGSGRKRIFSSPTLFDDTVYFGAYDGNFYALNAKTGKPRWINFDADWIGSSPCVSEQLGLVYVGLEFGLWKRQGGIAAFDAKTGEKRWSQPLETYVHSSPAYSQALNMVAVGSQSGEVAGFNAKTGEKIWSFELSKDVKGGIAFDEKRGLVMFGSWDDHIYILRAKDGSLVHAIKTYKPIYSTPVVQDGKLYMGLLDKRIMCMNLDSGEMVWQFQTQSRVFATPVFIDGKLYCGSNDGRMYVLDPTTGALLSFFQVTERIVNKIAYNKTTDRIFLPTYANELYCLRQLKG